MRVWDWVWIKRRSFQSTGGALWYRGSNMWLKNGSAIVDARKMELANEERITTHYRRYTKTRSDYLTLMNLFARIPHLWHRRA